MQPRLPNLKEEKFAAPKCPVGHALHPISSKDGKWLESPHVMECSMPIDKKIARSKVRRTYTKKAI